MIKTTASTGAITNAALRTLMLGEASDGDAAVFAVLEHGPDVILIDVRMLGKDGPCP